MTPSIRQVRQHQRKQYGIRIGSIILNKIKQLYVFSFNVIFSYYCVADGNWTLQPRLKVSNCKKFEDHKITSIKIGEINISRIINS